MSGGVDYHLRELRADLAAARSTLRGICSHDPPRQEQVRGWLDVESLIHHDLDVHLPALSKALGGGLIDDRGAVDGDEGVRLGDEGAREQVEALLRAAAQEMTADRPGWQAARRTRALLVRAWEVASRARADSVKRAQLK